MEGDAAAAIGIFHPYNVATYNEVMLTHANANANADQYYHLRHFEQYGLQQSTEQEMAAH